MKSLAPISITVYDRLNHLKQTIVTLQQNTLAKQSDVFIFSDGPKKGDEKKVDNVRKYLDTVNGFKNVYIIKQKNNNLLENLSQARMVPLNKYGKIIRMEDDIVTAPGFLNFINEGLNYYQVFDNIFSISGYCPDIKFPNNYNKDIYFLPRFNAWGFGMWKKQYQKIKAINKEEYYKYRASRKMNDYIHKVGLNVFPLFEAEVRGIFNAQDVRATYYQFLHDVYTVYPVKSLVQNIGNDGTGMHCSASDKYNIDLWDRMKFNFSNEIALNKEITKSFYRFSKVGLLLRVIIYIKKSYFYNMLLKIIKH